MMNIEVNYKAAIPIYEQIKQGLKMAILSGGLQNGKQAPSVRELSTQLKVSQNTVLKAYFQLDQEKFLESRPGSGYFVSWRDEKISSESEKLFHSALDDFITRMAGLGFTPADIIKAIEEKTGLDP